MAHKINVENMKQYLKNECGLRGDSLAVKKFSDGQSNPTFYLKMGETELVLRKKPPGRLLPGAHQVGREYRVMKALNTVGFPVPRVVAHCTDESVVGTEFFIMEFMQGKVYQFQLPGETPEEIKKSIFSAVGTLAKLHAVHPEEIGLADYGRTKGFCQRQVNTWWRQYEAAKHKIIPEMNELNEWLRNNIPPDVSRASIAHGDYSLANIMLDPAKNEVKCILDWELSTLGDPLLDLAYFCLAYSLPQEEVEAIYPGLDLTSVLKEEDVVGHYCRVRGIPFPPPDWNFYNGLACFKLASILQGVYRRFLQGNASQASAEFCEQRIQPLAAAGLNAAKRYAGMSALQIVDGPDEVHSSLIAKMEIIEKMKKAKL